MAALCTGTSYGLSNLKANDNKELIFVKLTDSAFRAIEEYNRNKVSAHRCFVCSFSIKVRGAHCDSSTHQSSRRVVRKFRGMAKQLDRSQDARPSSQWWD